MGVSIVTGLYGSINSPYSFMGICIYLHKRFLHTGLKKKFCKKKIKGLNLNVRKEYMVWAKVQTYAVALEISV